MTTAELPRIRMWLWRGTQDHGGTTDSERNSSDLSRWRGGGQWADTMDGGSSVKRHGPAAPRHVPCPAGGVMRCLVCGVPTCAGLCRLQGETAWAVMGRSSGVHGKERALMR